MRHLICALAVAALALAGCAPPDASGADSASVSTSPAGPSEDANGDGLDAPPADGDLDVHFLDVAQGSAVLFVHADATLLYDSGRHNATDVVGHLDRLGIDHLDVLIGSHPHADHIGQHDKILASDDLIVDEVWMAGTVTTTATFDRVMDAIEQSNVAYSEPRAGQKTTIGPLAIDIIGPTDAAVAGGDLHDASLAMRATYGDVTFLLTGDAETATEARYVADHADLLAADIYMAGHHGSSTSTTTQLLDAADPDVTVISAGADNRFGHPHAEVVDRLAAHRTDTYGTWVHGTVTITTDGTTYTVSTQREGTVAAGGPAQADDTSHDAHDDSPPSDDTTIPTDGCVDLNNADAADLQRIAHIGDARANAIIDGRPWTTVEDLSRIDGIGPARLEDIATEGLACVS